MRYLLFLTFIFALLPAREFSVATYNVENLFDATFQGSEYDAYIPGKHGWNKAMVRRKLERIAEVICEMDADIVALQEVENERVFLALRKLLKRVGCAYRYGEITRKRGAPVQVALLSRYKILRSNELQVSIAPRVRNILEVRIDTPGEPIVVFVNHWKSKGREGFESKRFAYAKRLMQRLSQISPDTPIVLLGDFNTDINAYEYLETKIDDTGGKSALFTVLPLLRDGYPVGEAQMMRAKGLVFYDLWYEVPLSKRWSRKFYGQKGSVDHIILSNAFFDRKGVDYKNDTFKVFKRPYLFTKKGHINRWVYKHGKHTGKGYSDHLPVMATLSTDPYRPSRISYLPAPPQPSTIADLYKTEGENRRFLLRHVALLLKRGRSGVIKGFGNDRGIFLYGAASDLKEGACYDLIVGGLKRYKGLVELQEAYPVKRHERCDTDRLYKESEAYLLNAPKQNEVMRDIEGVYRKGKLHLSGGSIPIRFKKRRFVPPEGSRIKLHYAHVGYYKRLQLVVYRKKDFEVK